MRVLFSHNWNGKLDNEIFSTIRRRKKEKEEYYVKNIGSEFDVVLNDTKRGTAKLLNVIVAQTLGDIDETLLMLDTGQTSYEGALNVFKQFGVTLKTEVLVLIFQRKCYVI